MIEVEGVGGQLTRGPGRDAEAPTEQCGRELRDLGSALAPDPNRALATGLVGLRRVECLGAVEVAC
jgi:hypothetical protein